MECVLKVCTMRVLLVTLERESYTNLLPANFLQEQLIVRKVCDTATKLNDVLECFYMYFAPTRMAYKIFVYRHRHDRGYC